MAGAGSIERLSASDRGTVDRMRSCGRTIDEIQQWLAANGNPQCSRSAVGRYTKRLDQRRARLAPVEDLARALQRPLSGGRAGAVAQARLAMILNESKPLTAREAELAALVLLTTTESDLKSPRVDDFVVVLSPDGDFER